MTRKYSRVESRLFNWKVTTNSSKKIVETLSLSGYEIEDYHVTFKWSSSLEWFIWLVDNWIPTLTMTGQWLVINLKMTWEKVYLDPSGNITRDWDAEVSEEMGNDDIRI